MRYLIICLVILVFVPDQAIARKRCKTISYRKAVRRMNRGRCILRFPCRKSQKILEYSRSVPEVRESVPEVRESAPLAPKIIEKPVIQKIAPSPIIKDILINPIEAIKPQLIEIPKSNKPSKTPEKKKKDIKKAAPPNKPFSILDRFSGKKKGKEDPEKNNGDNKTSKYGTIRKRQFIIAD